jgi:hypothetical protein
VRFSLGLVPYDCDGFFIFRDMEVPRIEVGMVVYNLVDYGPQSDPSDHTVEELAWDALVPDALIARLGWDDQWGEKNNSGAEDRAHAAKFYTREALLAGWYRNWTVEGES